jgi:hypothetical protein
MSVPIPLVLRLGRDRERMDVRLQPRNPEDEVSLRPQEREDVGHFQQLFEIWRLRTPWSSSDRLRRDPCHVLGAQHGKMVGPFSGTVPRRRGARRQGWGGAMAAPRVSFASAMRPMVAASSVVGSVLGHVPVPLLWRAGEKARDQIGVVSYDFRRAGHAHCGPVDAVEVGGSVGRTHRLAALEGLQIIAIARAGQRNQLPGVPVHRACTAHCLEARDANGRHIQRKGKASRGRNTDANTGEIAGTHADSDGVDGVERLSPLRQHGLNERHQAFGLTLGHGLMALGEDAVAP